MEVMKFLRCASVALLAAGTGVALQGSSVSAQTSGADAIKMFDTDSDGSIDLVEAKAAAAALFDTLDADHDGTVTNAELGGRATMSDNYCQVRAPIKCLPRKAR